MSFLGPRFILNMQLHDDENKGVETEGDEGTMARNSETFSPVQIYRPRGEVICLIAGYYDIRKIVARQLVGNVLIMRNYFHTFRRGGRPAGIKYS